MTPSYVPFHIKQALNRGQTVWSFAPDGSVTKFLKIGTMVLIIPWYYQIEKEVRNVKTNPENYESGRH